MKIWRRSLAVGLALMLSAVAWAESVLCVQADSMAALVRRDGTAILAPGAYDAMFCLVEDALYAGGVKTEQGRRYALLDASGTALTAAEYEMLAASDDRILFRKDGVYGAMDARGNVRVEAKWTQLTGNGAGGYLAALAEPEDEHVRAVYLLEEGREPVETGVRIAGELSAFASERMPFQDPDTKLCGYLDPRGKVAIEARYAYAGAFEDGLAKATDGGRMGLIGPEGEWRVPAEYDYLERGDGIFVALKRPSLCVVYDGEGAELFRLEKDGIQASVVGAFPILLAEDALVAYTREGKVLMRADARATILKGAGGQLLVSEGDWGTACVSVIDGEGQRLGRRDQYLLPVGDSRYAFMEMDVAAYRSNALGEIRYSCDYNSMRFGLMDTSGEEILPAKYREIVPLSEDRLLAVQEDGAQMIDLDGNVLWSYIEETME